MKPSELYELKPILIDRNCRDIIGGLASIKTVDGDKDTFLHYFSLSTKETKDFELNSPLTRRVYLEEGLNENMIKSSLYAIYYDETPLMIVKKHNAIYSTYLTNVEMLEKKVRPYLFSLRKSDYENISEKDNIHHIEQVDVFNLLNYYTYAQYQEYQIGEKVWGWVSACDSNYPYYAQDYLLMKLEIVGFNADNKIRAYKVKILNRCLEHYHYETEDGDIDLYVKKFVKNVENRSEIELLYSYTNKDYILGRVIDIEMPDLAIENYLEHDRPDNGEDHLLLSLIINKEDLKKVSEKILLEAKLPKKSKSTKLKI